MKNLKLLRKAAGYSQLQLAAFLYTNPSTISNWELGKSVPRIGQMVKMCRVLNCIPSDFFDIPDCENGCTYIPVFSQTLPCDVTFEEVSADNSYPPLHFGIKLNSDLSGRLRNGDVCFFSMEKAAAEGDIVLGCDENFNERILPFYLPENNIAPVAVCHFARMTV